MEEYEQTVPMIPPNVTEVDPENWYFFIEWIKPSQYNAYLRKGYEHAKMAFLEKETQWATVRRKLEKEMLFKTLLKRSQLLNKPYEY